MRRVTLTLPSDRWSSFLVAAICATLLVACGTTPGASSPTDVVTPGTSITASDPKLDATPNPTASATEEGRIAGLFDVGGRSLFLECRGSGSPSVIFLAGTDVPRNAMRAIEEALLEEGARVCDYDRAGSGQSDRASAPQNDLEVVGDLALLLEAAEVPQPYVLVGQSVGGDQAWLFANRHPTGLGGFLMMNAGPFVLDRDQLKGALTEQEIADEQAVSIPEIAAAKQAASPPAGVPYVVMMSTNAQCGSPTDVCGRIYPFYEAWAKELAGRTPDGRFVQAEASHEIFLEMPELVIDEVKKVIAAIP